MASYNTEQKRILVEYLTKHSEESFTIEELCLNITKQKSCGSLGKSTIYRLIPGLVSDGIVKRFPSPNSRKFLYQLVSGKDCPHHLHLKCTGCGKLLHMPHSLSQGVMSEIKSTNDFTIDSRQTILFGTCSECNKKE